MKKLHQKLVSKLHSPKKSDPLKEQERQQTLALHTIYTDHNPDIDIIVLHGHTGHYRDSFTHQSSHCFWLQDLLPSVFHGEGKGVRVLSFSYSKEDEDALGSEKIVHFLGGKLLSLPIPYRNHKSADTEKPKLLFVAHSFGGSLLQGVLAAPENEWLRSQTVGVLLFGVARGNGWGNLVGAMGGVKEEDLSEEIRDMRREVEWLKICEEGFEGFCKEWKWEVWWFREGNGCVGNPERVEREGGGNVVLMDRTHGAMVRFEGEGDEEWRKVKGVLIDVVARIVD